MMLRRFALATIAGTAFAAPLAQAAAVLFTQITTAFNSPIGIDYYEPTNRLIVSANYFSGLPNNLQIVAADGSFANYSLLSGQTNELKIATVRSGYTTGFAVGTVFTGSGQDGVIVKVDPGTAAVTNPWVSLPGANNGLIRGSLYVDRTGVYNGDLLVVTTAGQLWRINSVGTPTQIGTSLGVHLEGLSVIPNDVSRWGAKAGCIVAGAEGQTKMHTWCRNATTGAMVHSEQSVLTQGGRAIAIEDIDVIDGGNFFGVNFGTSKLVGVAASAFTSMVGDILLTEEFPVGGTGLHRMYWDSGTSAFGVEAITAAAGSTSLGQWEHVTFANAGVVEIPPVGVPVVGTAWLVALGLGLAGAMRLRRRN